MKSWIDDLHGTLRIDATNTVNSIDAVMRSFDAGIMQKERAQRYVAAFQGRLRRIYIKSQKRG